MRYRRYQGFSLNPIWIIIAINLLMLVTTIISPKLISLLGLAPAIFLSRPWTIVTNLFIHGGLWHLLANMLTLYFFGRYLSRLIGDSKLLIVYFAGGILGNILYILLGEPLSVAIGASGSVFALGGALTMMRPKLSVLVFPIPVPLPLWVAVIGGFLILSFLPFVAWQAHLGGLIIGLIAAISSERGSTISCSLTTTTTRTAMNILAFCYIEMRAIKRRSVGALNLPIPLNHTDDN